MKTRKPFYVIAILSMAIMMSRHAESAVIYDPMPVGKLPPNGFFSLDSPPESFPEELLCKVRENAAAQCAPFATCTTATNDVRHIRAALDSLDYVCATNQWNYRLVEEAMNFERIKESPDYRAFASVVSNDWTLALEHLDELATNDLERLLILGVGKTYDEDFYIEHMGALASMVTNNLVLAEEFSWARASTRFDLQSCLIRRYQEPKVIALIDKYKAVQPDRTNYWDSVLSGVAYTNYLEEVKAGLWQ